MHLPLASPDFHARLFPTKFSFSNGSIGEVARRSTGLSCSHGTFLTCFLRPSLPPTLPQPILSLHCIIFTLVCILCFACSPLPLLAWLLILCPLIPTQYATFFLLQQIALSLNWLSSSHHPPSISRPLFSRAQTTMFHNEFLPHTRVSSVVSLPPQSLFLLHLLAFPPSLP